jgi:hypothetical protein
MNASNEFPETAETLAGNVRFESTHGGRDVSPSWYDREYLAPGAGVNVLYVMHYLMSLNINQLP